MGVTMRVTIYAGSSEGGRPEFRQAAEAFTAALVHDGHEIVYGGGAHGLMGVVADTALALGGQVTGVMPRGLAEAELAHRGLTRLHIVDSMHQRKQMLAELGDCYVALPGGSGTLEEIAEVWTLLHLGDHVKPVLLLNTAGYWDHLTALAAHMAAHGFLRPTETTSLIPVADAGEFRTAVHQWRPPAPRWGSPSIVSSAASVSRAANVISAASVISAADVISAG